MATLEEKEIAKSINTLARHQMIMRIESDILVDMQVCDIEGWDKMEYINMIANILDEFRRTYANRK